MASFAQASPFQTITDLAMAPRKILMLTNAELGQANVFIATTHSLLEQESDIEIHIASLILVGL